MIYDEFIVFEEEGIAISKSRISSFRTEEDKHGNILTRIDWEVAPGVFDKTRVFVPFENVAALFGSKAIFPDYETKEDDL